MIKKIEISFTDKVPCSERDVGTLFHIVCMMTGQSTFNVISDNPAVTGVEPTGPVPTNFIELTSKNSFDMSEELARMLDNFCNMLCKRYNEANPEMIMWPAGCGSKPLWSTADAAFLGKTASPGAPESGEPNWDDSVYAIECFAREDYHGSNPHNPRYAELQAEKKAKQNAERDALPVLQGVSRMADNAKAILLSFDRELTDDQIRELHVRF